MIRHYAWLPLQLGQASRDKFLYVIDCVVPYEDIAAHRIVVITSAAAHRATKVCRKLHTTDLYLPTWTLPELLSARPSSIGDADIRTRFEIFGGVPRAVYNIGYSAEQLHQAVARLEIPDDWMGMIDKPGGTSDQLFHIRATDSLEREGVYPASPFVTQLLIRSAVAADRRSICLALETVGYVQRIRFAFEAICHRILRRGGQFKLNRLTSLSLLPTDTPPEMLLVFVVPPCRATFPEQLYTRGKGRFSALAVDGCCAVTCLFICDFACTSRHPYPTSCESLCASSD